MDIVAELLAQGKRARDAGDIELALERYASAAHHLRARGDALAVAHTVRHLADMLRESGRPEAAESLYDVVLETYASRDDADALDRANALRGSALNREARGQREAAIAAWTHARALYRAADVHAGVAEADRRLAAL